MWIMSEVLPSIKILCLCDDVFKSASEGLLSIGTLK